MIPKVQVTSRGNYARNDGYKTGLITQEFETKTFSGIWLVADAVDVEEAGVLDCFVEVGVELRRTQVTPEVDVFTFVKIAGHTGMTVESTGCVSANAADIAKALEVSEGALKDYGVETSRDLIALLLQLEEGYGLVPSEDSMGLTVDPEAPHAPKLAQSIKSWAEKRAELERGELDEDAYADWKASF